MGEVEGDVDAEDGVMFIKSIRVRYRLRMSAGKEEEARRAHEVHHPKCPVYKTLSGCIDIRTELELKIDGA